MLSFTARGACSRALALALALTASGMANADRARAADPVERGRYLTTIMDCNGCHTPGALIGQPDMEHPLSGSDVGFQLPGLGIFYPPNLTPDEATGLGKWSEADIVKAIRTGIRPDGRELAPIMAWRSYGALTDADAAAIAAYLKSLTPVAHKAPGPFGEGEKPTHPYMTVAMPQ
ncbi:MAG: c-type cytochrome [Pseudomonadota bacterium]